MKPKNIEDKLNQIVSLCKRRGFVFPNSEIYGGIQGFYDYGPLGVEMKNNIKQLWWRWMVQYHHNIVGIDGAIITHPRVWEASGHVDNFTDPLVDCKNCRKRFRADSLLEETSSWKGVSKENFLTKLALALKNKKCPECGGELTEPRRFNLLVGTSLGVVEDDKRMAFLRGEACQNIYLNYANVISASRLKIPFGIVQIGKAFRNEITPKQFLYRQREFEQWDLQWFTRPDEMEKWFEYWKKERFCWYQSLINQQDALRLRQHRPDELAHYAKVAFDIEYQTPFGWREWEGIHWRGDWDLSRHGQFSGHDFTYTDPVDQKKYIPCIVETSGGVDRTFLYLLFDAFREEGEGDKKRVFLQLHPLVAPFKVAVFPLLANKEALVKKAKEIYQSLSPEFMSTWDERGNIGKRYYSQDEIGTPWCITIDFQTLEDDTVTIRDRDTAQQKRIKGDAVANFLRENLKISYKISNYP